jgi:hypothetical protein
VVGFVVVVVVVELLDVAAVAIAAPPPASTPVTARAIRRDLSRRGIGCHLLSSTAQTIHAVRLSTV